MDLQVTLDEETAARLRARAERKGYDSPEAYGEAVLRIVMDELEGNNDHVENRLRDLGYLE